MNSSDNDGPKPDATQILAALVAKRKAAQVGGGKNLPGQRQSERSAAHRSASKSQPALRK